jgi:hypothetical protein
MTHPNTVQRTFRGVPVTKGSLIDRILELKTGLAVLCVIALIECALFLTIISGLFILIIVSIAVIILIETVTAKCNRAPADPEPLAAGQTP